MQLIAAIFLGMLVSLPAFASEVAGTEKYVPLFEVDNPYEPGTVTEGYMKAYNSKTREAAIPQWEAFLAEYVQNEPPSFEDVTDLTLIRQAHYELMRLYYLAGRLADADKILIKAHDIAVFMAPEAGEAKKWCRIRGYCK